MTIKPMHDKLLVRLEAQANQTKGGLFIPDTAKEKPLRGEVIGVGDGRRLPDGTTQPLDVKLGDLVLFTKYGGTPVKLEDGHDYLLIAEGDVLGTVVDATP